MDSAPTIAALHVCLICDQHRLRALLSTLTALQLAP